VVDGNADRGASRSRSEAPTVAQSGTSVRFSPATAAAVAFRISVRDPKISEEADRERASGLWGVATSPVRRSGESGEPATG